MSPAAVLVPFRVTLGLDELVLAARLVDAPLPVRTDRAVPPERLVDRLDSTATDDARAALAAALDRVDDVGPDGARARLSDRDLLDGDTVDPGVASALAVLAAGPLGGLLDVTVVRAEGDLRVRTWLGVSPSAVAQLSTGDGLDYELSWCAPELWVGELTRAIDTDPWVPRPAPMRLPPHVSLPSELLAGSSRAHRERRTDLVPAMVAAHAGRVRLGTTEPVRQVRVADADETLRLLDTLGRHLRGRLRLVLQRRDGTSAKADAPVPPVSVASWLLLDDGWHELAPGPDASAVLRRRDARDLGLFSWPAVRDVVGEGR